MSDGKDYLVTIKVRNDRLVSAIERAGFSPGAIFAKAAGVGYASLNDLINMKLSPLDKDGNIRPIVEQLMCFLNANLHDLFNDQQIYEPVESNVSEFALDSFQVQMLNQKSPEQLAIGRDVSDASDDSLAMLTERERFVIERRYGFFGNEMTLKEIADELDLSVERVRQIEAKAFRKMRGPKSPAERVRDVFVPDRKYDW